MRPSARGWGRTFQNGVTKNAVRLINVATKSVGCVHRVWWADIYDLDGTSLVNTPKKMINKIEQFDAILILIEKIIIFSTTGYSITL